MTEKQRTGRPTDTIHSGRAGRRFDAADGHGSHRRTRRPTKPGDEPGWSGSDAAVGALCRTMKHETPRAGKSAGSPTDAPQPTTDTTTASHTHTADSDHDPEGDSEPVLVVPSVRDGRTPTIHRQRVVHLTACGIHNRDADAQPRDAATEAYPEATECEAKECFGGIDE